MRFSFQETVRTKRCCLNIRSKNFHNLLNFALQAGHFDPKTDYAWWVFCSDTELGEKSKNKKIQKYNEYWSKFSLIQNALKLSLQKRVYSKEHKKLKWKKKSSYKSKNNIKLKY